jgi:hypothetical protein
MLAIPCTTVQNDRRDDHPDELDECIAKRLHGAGGLRVEVSEQDSDDHSAQHLKIEMLIKLLLRRRRRRMCLRHAYLHSHQARAVALGP